MLGLPRDAESSKLCAIPGAPTWFAMRHSKPTLEKMFVSGLWEQSITNVSENQGTKLEQEAYQDNDTGCAGIITGFHRLMSLTKYLSR